MGVGQIRPVVKCRAPHRAVRGSPAARGKTKRSSPAAVGLRCDAADSPVPRGEGMRPTTLPGRRRRTSRGTGNCPAPREVLPLLKKADVQASTPPGDSTELREDVHAVRKRLPESHAARKTRSPHGCRRKHAKDAPGGARGKTAIQIRKAPFPGRPSRAGKNARPGLSAEEAHGRRLFFSGAAGDGRNKKSRRNTPE